MKTEKPSLSPLGVAPGWRERALERSQAITDAWEVTKTYAGRLAEWVLFGCMVMNILQILPGVSLWPAVSNLVLGTQVVMLDVGGFSLASMAEQAREQGDERAAGRASRTGFLLIGIMMLTLLLVSVGVLWPAAKVYTDLAEKGLILVRVIMTVLYSHVMHSLRRMGVQQQQATLAEMFSELSARLSEQCSEQIERTATSLSGQFSEQLQQVQAQMQHVQGVQSSLSPLVQAAVEAQTQPTLNELHRVQFQFTEVHALVQALTLRLTELAQQQEQTHESTYEPARKGQEREARPSMTLVHSRHESGEYEPANRQGSEPLEQRIKQYILVQREQGHEPSLAEIMDRCACSKGSAIRYRRELGEEATVGERRVVGE